MENLKPLRKQKGLTMKQLGELVGVSESMIGYLESGERSPSFETLLKLGEALDCTVDFLLRGEIKTPSEIGERNVLDLSNLSADQVKGINLLIKLNPQQLSAFVSLAESLNTDSQAPGDPQ